ncbi:MAG: hypothetical protein U5N86_05140 [Planctomycetota bacterium]|nr:hypothetical protein [Planctomycetota bacterium]
MISFDLWLEKSEPAIANIPFEHALKTDVEIRFCINYVQGGDVFIRNPAPAGEFAVCSVTTEKIEYKKFPFPRRNVGLGSLKK